MKVVIGILSAILAAVAAYVLWSFFGPTSTPPAGEQGDSLIVQPPTPVADDRIEAAPTESVLGASDVRVAPEPGFYSEDEYAGFKEDYNCELARNARTQCEAVDRGPDGLEQCLKLSQYYTYTRHCGKEE